MTTLKEYKKLIDISKVNYTSTTRVWDVALLFVQGRQHIEYDKNINRYISSKSSAGRYRVSINLLLNFYRTVLSKLQIVTPNITVLPASASTEDLIKARTSEDAFKYYYHRDSFAEDKSPVMLQWLITLGTVGLHTYFDSEDDEIKTNVISPYDIFVEKGAQAESQSRFIAIRQYTTKDELKSVYPDKTKEIDEAITTSMTTTGTGNTTNYELSDRVEIFEVFGVDGTTGIVMGDIVLFEGKWSGTHPVQIIRYTKVPGKFWGLGLIEPLIELQALYNNVRAQVVQNVELMSNPKWLIPKTAGVSADAIKGRPGEKIYYNIAGGEPKQVSMAPIPSYVLDNVVRLHSEMMDVAGLHATSMGKRSVGVTSGKAIEALSSQDVSQLQVTQKNIERAIKNMATKVLELMQEFYPEKKMMKMMDSYGKIIFKELKRTSLQENPEVFIEAGSIFADTAEARDAQVLNLFKAQLLTPEEARSALSFHTGQDFISQETSDMAHAQEMIQAIIDGNNIEIFASDNLPVFMKVITDFMRTEDFYELEVERQDYFSDILVAITSFGKEDGEYEQLLINKKVFPRATVKPEQLVDSVALNASPASQEQVANDGLGLAEKQERTMLGKSLVDEVPADLMMTEQTVGSDKGNN